MSGLRAVGGLLATVLIAPIRCYQRWVSPAFPQTCRFYPSCSAYAVEALRRHGPLVGLFLAVRRLLKCAPWHPGGLDPVPERVRLGRGVPPVSARTLRQESPVVP